MADGGEFCFVSCYKRKQEISSSIPARRDNRRLSKYIILAFLHKKTVVFSLVKEEAAGVACIFF
jgi:hypothetical protein